MKKSILSLSSASLLALTLLTSSCGSSKSDPTPNSLYARMGGKASMEAITDQLVANIGAEIGAPNTLMLRSHQPMLDAVNGVNGAAPTDPTRLTRLRNNVVDQFTSLTGGPLPYQGKNMLLAHTNMHVTEAEYTTWRLMLDNSLTKNNIATREKAEFTALIDAMRAEVVNH